jgi:cytochrome P450
MASRPVDLSPAETASVLRNVLTPLVAQGAIVRRPSITGWAERRQADRRTSAVLDELRERHDGAPLVVRLGPRRLVLLTEPDDVARVLDGSPEPFTPRNREKRGALRHFQPEGVLVSRTQERRHRRPLNERALARGQAVHPAGEAVVEQVERMVDELTAALDQRGELDAGTFAEAHWRLVRTVVLGEGARDDELLTDRLTALRRAANWSWFRPVRRRVRAPFLEQVRGHVERAEPGALAAAAGTPEIAGQVPHWLFAFDAVAMATLRALAVVSARPEVRERVLAEYTTAGRGASLLPYTRACVLESVRLWPTTLVVLRDSTEPTLWGGRTLPAGTGFAVISAYAHRDRSQHGLDGRFVPEAWLDGRAEADRALIPFSAGPADCAGQDVVLFTASHLLARLAGLGLDVDRGEHLARDPLPRTVDHHLLRFRLGARAGRGLGTVESAPDGRAAAVVEPEGGAA